MRERFPVVVCVPCMVGLCAYFASHAQANVDLEWRPIQSNAAVGDTVEIALLALSDDQSDQAVGLIEAILLWDETQLELLGHLENGPYVWFGPGFNDDSSFDGLNDPFAGIPNNDGNALFSTFSQLGVFICTNGNNDYIPAPCCGPSLHAF